MGLGTTETYFEDLQRKLIFSDLLKKFENREIKYIEAKRDYIFVKEIIFLQMFFFH